MNEKMPRTPFSTPLSGSAKEAEIRIRNIFSGPKKRPPLPFLILMFAVCIFCGNIVSCQVAEPDIPDVSEPPAASSAQPGPEPPALPAPDLNQNGIPEDIRLENEFGWDEVRFYENGELILRETPGDYLCTLDGVDYILRSHLYEEQGDFRYSYKLARFNGEFEETQQWNEVRFDTNFNALFHKGFDPEEIAAFVDELNELLAHSVRLSVADGELVVEDSQPETLPWLDSFPDIFTRVSDKSLLENLRDFRSAMPQDLKPPAASGTALFLDQPIELDFSSGAGAWWTTLTLHGDGSFEGDYMDADMDTHYVCQFHGRFGNIAEASNTSFYMTLEELVLDTKYPVGQEWDEGGIHYISSEPYGLTGTDGKALEPGAGFVFYLPGATGHEPGTDLYGATEFITWLPLGYPHVFYAPEHTLNLYGLHNLETGYGFFCPPSDT